MSGSPSIRQPTIEILVNTDGSTTVQTHGFSGSSCRDASAFLRRALGRVSSDQATAEMHQQVQEPHHERETS